MRNDIKPLNVILEELDKNEFSDVTFELDE